MEYRFTLPVRKFNYYTPFTSSVCLTGIYLIISIVWILTSDSMAGKLAGKDTNTLQHLQQYKGILFVLLSGGLLYFISNRFYRNLAKSSQQRETLEKKFLALNEAAREGIFDCDLENMTARLNNKMRFFLPVVSDTIEDFWRIYQRRIHPDDIPQLLKEYDEIAKSERSVWQIEYRLLGCDNSYYHVVSSIYILRSAGGRPVRLIGTLLDISELRKLQADKYEQRLKHKRELAASVIRVQENERERWAQELHDNVCQLLTVGNLYLSRMEKCPETVPQLLPQAKKIIADSMAEIRQLSASIKPPSFSETTLKESVENLVAGIKRVKEIAFSFDFEKLNEMKLCEEQKLLSYRIVQEQLNNIIKYADAKKVEISLGQETNEFIIKVKDDGKGFNTGNAKKGIGLRNIQSRLQLYKGNMQIESSPGNGCTLVAAFHV